MEMKWINQKHKEDALFAKLQGRWLTCNTFSRFVFAEQLIDIDIDIITYKDRHISIRMVYNNTGHPYYVLWNNEKIIYVPTLGVFNLLANEKIGYLVGGYYISETDNLKNTPFERLRKNKLNFWIEDAGCKMPYVIADNV